MKRTNYQILFTLIITVNLILASNSNSQWTVCGNLAGISGRPTVSVVDENTVWVTGGSTVNATYRTTNGGADWATINTTGINPFLCIWAKDANTVFAGDDGAGGTSKFYKTTNGGISWILIDSVSNTTGFRSIKFSNSIPTFGIALGGWELPNYFLFKTRDGGNTWTKYVFPIFTGYSSAISGLNVIDSLFYSFGTTGGSPSVVSTTNGGVTYSLHNLGLDSIGGNFTRGVAFKDDKLTGISGSTTLPTISRTTNGGLNWTNISIGNFVPNASSPVMRWIEGTNTFYLASPYSSGILKSINGGMNWTEMNTQGLGMFNMDTKKIGSTVYGYAVTFAISGTNCYVLKTADPTSGIENISSEVPNGYSLNQNYPNPFNPVTNLEFGISKLGFVSLKVFDVLGKEVATLINSFLSAGTYKYDFDGSNLSSGVYFYKLETDGFVDTKKMYLVK